MIRVGQRAPDFSAVATDGRTVSLLELRGRPVVLFFFPKAFTTVCTLEARQFCEQEPEWSSRGATVIGISTDAPETQRQFAKSVGAPYPMIGDEDRSITRSFGVMWPLVGIARRVTVIIDGDGVVAGVLHHELSASKHISGTIATLDRLALEGT